MNATVIFEQIIAALPPDANPFLGISAAITAQFYPTLPSSFTRNLHGATAIFITQAFHDAAV